MKQNIFHFAALFTTLSALTGAGYAAEPPAPQNLSIVADAAAKALDQSWRVAGDVRIEIGNVRGSVAVSGWDRSEVKLSGSLGAGSRLEVSGDEHQLALRVSSTHTGWFGGNGPDHDSELVLNVPRGGALQVNVVSADATVTGIAGKSLDVNGVSGKLSLDSEAPQVDVNSVSGEIVFAAAQVNTSARAHLQTVSGDIDAKNLGGRVKLETVSGNIHLDAGQLQELETGTVSGDARIQATPAAHARMTLESMSGDIRLRLPPALSAHIEAKTFSGGIGSDYGKVQNKERGPGSSLDARVGDGDVQINAQSFSGNIELRKQGG